MSDTFKRVHVSNVRFIAECFLLVFSVHLFLFNQVFMHHLFSHIVNSIIDPKTPKDQKNRSKLRSDATDSELLLLDIIIFVVSPSIEILKHHKRPNG